MKLPQNSSFLTFIRSLISPSLRIARRRRPAIVLEVVAREGTQRCSMSRLISSPIIPKARSLGPRVLEPAEGAVVVEELGEVKEVGNYNRRDYFNRCTSASDRG